MTTLTQYKCDICGTLFSSSDDATRCEESHLTQTMCISGIGINKDQKYPFSVKIKFDDDKEIEYKRI